MILTILLTTNNNTINNTSNTNNGRSASVVADAGISREAGTGRGRKDSRIYVYR